MLASVRNPLLCLFGALAALLTAVTPAAASSQPGAACSDPTVSAVNQYCELIPSATGGHAPGPGTPALAGHLSSPVKSELRDRRGGQSASSASGRAPASRSATRRQGPARKLPGARARRALLTLPAPSPRALFGAAAGPRSSTWSLFSGLIGVLAAATLVAAVLALVRRRRGTPT